ncbi:PREDICTED: THO complex subunit 6 [Nicrophorus vespilloides]|uniref:THO complex subunit 6 n=1 Tax=Nicrophorus vespilloides TaxID=110193 RepID=A0ABM1MDK8_NICVS|nr:PREDICTED: THO complex subunit 6 [Nicrophorus vespilloides]
MKTMADKNYYNTILSQVFSPCGKYLIVGDIYGYISVFNLQKVVCPESSTNAEDRKAKNVFMVQADIQINSLLAADNLIVGTVGEILAFNWQHIINSADAKAIWRIEIPNTKDNFEKVDINCMVQAQSGDIYVGCGDNSIRIVNIESGSIVNTLNGHKDYVHSIANIGNELISGGEDGLVNMWDIRSKTLVHSIEPHKNVKLQRPELGNWIGAVALNDDWLLCGGGPRLSLWHFRSMNVSTVFPLDDKGIHVAEFFEDSILAGGRSNYFYNLNLDGTVVSEIQTSSVSIFSAIHQEEPYKALCLSGSSPHIDICNNYNYRDQILTVSI